MSEPQTPRFAVIPSKAIEDERISHACFRVLCTMHDAPSCEMIVRRLQIDQRDVRRHLAHLTHLGYLPTGGQTDV